MSSFQTAQGIRSPHLRSQRGKGEGALSSADIFANYAKSHICISSAFQSVLFSPVPGSLPTSSRFPLKARMFAALAFVHADYVFEAFVQLAADLPDELIPIANYFEDTYLGSVRRGQCRPPRLEPNMWSVYDRVNEDLPKLQACQSFVVISAEN